MANAMGQTFSIVCDDCHVKLWCAQDFSGNPEAFYIYGGNNAFPREDQEHSPLAEFLFMHQRHKLRFTSTDEEAEPEEDYLELAAEPGLPPQPDHEQPSWIEPADLEQMKKHYAANAGYIDDPEIRHLKIESYKNDG
jgi:hypothetical protein